MRVVTGAEMAEIDRKTIEEYGVPGAVLMENAARAVCREFLEHIGEERPRLLFLCGSGNNGGDGFCAARIMQGWGFPVRIAHVGRVQTLKPDALLYYNLARNFHVPVVSIKEEQDIPIFKQLLEETDWIFDALFGTGLSRHVKGVASAILDLAASSEKKSVAIDIPSGIDSDSGKVLGRVIPAEITVTFGIPKKGHLLFPGAGFIGRLTVADIGLVSEMPGSKELADGIITGDLVSSLLPSRPYNAHKGTCGKLGIVGGCRSLLGAALMAGQAAMRTGMGYVKMLLPHYIEPMAKASAPELVTEGLPDINGGYFSHDSTELCLKLLEDCSVLAIGPGIGNNKATRGFIIDILEENKKPAIIDADALNTLAVEDGFERDPAVPWIMTPHPGEAARLLKTETSEVLSDPLGCLERIVDIYKAVVVLKGPNSIIMNRDRRVNFNTTGSPALAVMGSGDVLTGIISALVCRGLPCFEAASAGVFIHGLVGETAWETSREGSIPSDFIRLIPQALDRIRRGDVKDRIKKLK